MLHKHPVLAAAARDHRPLLIELAAVYGDYQNRQPYSLVDGVCVIDLAGLLTNAPWPFGSTYPAIGEELARAIAWPECRGVLLRVNSPGGETDGAFELADAIAAAGKVKPVWAVAAVNCYSAAYLLASQAAKLYAAKVSGGVGSIGVYCAHFDYSQMLEKDGVSVTLISGGKGKTDGNPYEPLGSDARAALQADVDRLYSAFVSAVAQGRGMNTARVQSLGAALFNGSAAAVKAGLADGEGTFASVLANFQQSTDPAKRIFAAALPARADHQRDEPEMSNEGEEMQQQTLPHATEDTPLMRAIRNLGDPYARFKQATKGNNSSPLLAAMDKLIAEADARGEFGQGQPVPDGTSRTRPPNANPLLAAVKGLAGESGTVG